MTLNAILQMSVFIAALLALAKPLGVYIARVYQGNPCGLHLALGPVERLIYRLCGVDAEKEMSWKTYAFAFLAFNFVGAAAVYAMLRLQYWLPLNPQRLPGMSTDLAFNTAVSFATNTNWQSYAGESTLSYFSQMCALAVQNFVSAAIGMAILAALIRGLAGRETKSVGNFWFDLVRGTLYVLLPLSFVLALALV